MPKIGDVVAGKYRLDKVAGEGGMGIVYVAEHLVLRQQVAVKVLLPNAAASEAVVERFSREARAAARINTEHVARVMDAGSLASGAPFLVMEFLEGCDLDELLELEGTLDVTDVADYMLQALEALAHAHAAGIVHRDLKPANLFLASRPDGGNVIKVLDFGISKSMNTNPLDKKLTGQHVLGSPVYMSPEQLRNANTIDARADLWSLGIVAYELLVGKPPFDGDGVGEIFAAILETEAKPVHEVDWKLPPEISPVLARCLKRNPDERWQDAAELARAIAPFGSGAYKKSVASAEQVLARAKALASHETPLETRRVVDAIEQAALRARTKGGSTDVELALVQKKVDGETEAAPPAVIPANPHRTDDEAKPESARGLGGFAQRTSWRWLVAAAAVIAALFVGASALAIRLTSEAIAKPSHGNPNATVNGPVKTDKTSEDDVPMVMDLPDALGHASNGTAQRPRGNKQQPGAKPTRPKFLNTRE